MTKEDLIFLLLLDNDHYKDKYIVSELVTQKGIQSEINCDLGLISRILKKNEEEGYIYRKSMKIENKKRKQNVFFLTDKGLKPAEELRKEISN